MKYNNKDMNNQMQTAFYKWIKENNILSPNVKYTYWNKYMKPYANGNYSLDGIISFWDEGDNYYAMAVCDRILKLINKDKKKKGRTNKLSNAQSAYRKLKLFLLIGPRTSNPKLPSDATREFRKKINKSDLPKIDGNAPLLKELSPEKFIRLAVEGSYFFCGSIVKDRNNVLSDILKDKAPARKSEDSNLQKIENGELMFEDNGFKCKIDKDSDNNRAVRTLITKYSGYTVSQGEGSIFRNFIISHVWGRAYDPRFFTSFWNLVLIPSWANFLMDVEKAKTGSLESKMQSTFRAICKVLYDDMSGIIDVGKHSSIKDVDQYNDKIKGNYEINVIQMKTIDKKKEVAPIIVTSCLLDNHTDSIILRKL